jgi:hypothetical protein
MRPDPTFHASPKLAMEAPPENFAYTLLLSPDFSKPDAVIDVKPGSVPFCWSRAAWPRRRRSTAQLSATTASSAERASIQRMSGVFMVSMNT